MTLSIEAIDLHAQGQHGRVVFGGTDVLDAPGATILDKMLHFERHADWFRRLMLREPRGFPRACVNLVLPPCHPDADAGVIIMEQHTTYPGMSGTNTIVVVTALLETGRLPMREPITELTLEMPAGLVRVRAHCAGGRVMLVEFENQPSFATALDAVVEVDGLGPVRIDVAYGGMAYAVADAGALGIAIEPANGRRMQRAGIAIAAAARQAPGFRHPDQPAFATIEGCVLYNRPAAPGGRFRQTTMTVAGQMDPTPAGTGASAFLATRHARGEAAVGEVWEIEGQTGLPFRCTIAGETRLSDGTAAILPRIGGRAWISAYARYVLEDDDPFPEGLRIGDIWADLDDSSAAGRMAEAGRGDDGPGAR